MPALSVAAFALAASTQVYRQVFAREATLTLGKKSGRFVQEIVEPPRRGAILSADGKPLAQQAESATFGLTFAKVPHASGFFVDLADATNIPASEFEQLAADGETYREWRTPLSGEQVKRLQAVKRRWRADGLSIARAGGREYPLGTATSAMLGYMQDDEPMTGLELSLDAVLAGTAGKIIGMADRFGQFLPMHIEAGSVPATHGENVTLTLDSVLQQEAAEAIDRAVRVNQAKSGAAIILDPATGNILAMANAPAFDPDQPHLAKDLDVPIGYNPNYMARYDPGSTFKILTLAKALDAGVVAMDQTVACAGSHDVWHGRRIRCDMHGRGGGHGRVNATQAIGVSCNVSAAIWAHRIGHKPMIEYLDAMGLFEPTGLGFKGEVRGRFDRNEYAWGLQLANVGFGQAMSTTPVALASAFAMVANDGRRVYPRLIDTIGGRKQPVRKGEPVLRPETCHQVQKAMRAVIEWERGTGRSLRIPGYALGGKTGTAQKFNVKTGSYQGGGHVANFVGFVPAERPRAVILVMIDEPKGHSYYGGAVAGPVFLDLARACIRRLQIPKSSESAPPPPSSSGPSTSGGRRDVR